MANLTNLNNKFLVQTGGNVGINTTSPEEKLHIAGSTLISNNEFYKVEKTDGTNYKIAGLTNGNVIQIGAIDYTSAGTIFAGGDNIGITTGGAAGTTRIKIDSSGNVGIGTTTPLNKLTVSEATGQHGIELAPGTLSYLQCYDRATSTYGNMTIDAKYLAFGLNNGAEKIRFTADGDVGIGTTSPVFYSTGWGKVLGIKAASGYAVTQIAGSNGNGAEIDLGDASIRHAAIASLPGSNLGFYTNSTNSGDSVTERMRILSGGNVGIGTTSPGAKLDVNGATYVRNVIYGYAGAGNQYGGLSWAGTDEGFLFLKDSNVTKVLIASNADSYFNGGDVGIGSSNVDSKFKVELNPSGTVLAGLRIGYNSSSANYFDGDTQYFRNGAGTTERMRITSAGDINILNATATDSKSIGITNAAGTTGWTFGNGVLSNTHQFVIYDNTAGSSRMLIDSSGKVGIGNTSPSAKLTIDNSISTSYSTTGYAATPANSMLYLNNTNGGSNTASLINFRTGSGDGVLGFVEGGGTNDADFVIQTDGGSNGIERFRITNAGNVGIGTTSPSEKLQIVGNTYISGVGNQLLFDTTGALGSNKIKTINDYETVIATDRGSAGFAVIGNSNIRLGFGTNYTNAETDLYINTSGNVGIGETSPNGKLHIKDGLTCSIDIENTSNTGLGEITFNDPDADDRGALQYSHNLDAMIFKTDATEQVRILPTGSFCIGGTAIQAVNAVTFDAGSNGFTITNNTTSGAGNGHEFQAFRRNSTQIGSIVMNGTTGVTYATSSDYRLKEDLQDFNGLDKVSKIPVYDFKWKSDESRSYGVMAHELQEVLPQAVSGDKDAEEMQGVDYSKIVPLLVKSIQELKARVKELENK